MILINKNIYFEWLGMMMLLTCCGFTPIGCTEDIDWAAPENLPKPPMKAWGYPSREADFDVLPGFQKPEPGYGEVPFWWWTGDPLDTDRLLWQIEELHRKGVTGMQINYAHEDTPGWLTYPADPEIFSDRWWEFWRWTVEQCRKRNMGIGMSGYTIDWPGKKENLFGRLIYSDPQLNGDELAVVSKTVLEAGQTLSLEVPPTCITAYAYPLRNGIMQKPGINLDQYISSQKLEWTAREGQYQVWVFYSNKKPFTLNPLHPESGKRVVEKFFQPFVDHAPGQTSDGLNYFFQDELNFGVDGRLWIAGLEQEFQKRKGYNLFDVLPALFEDIGSLTPKVRLDYQDVKVQLMEERYFRPIFDWHWKRGLIYGCDPGSRGLHPAEFGDYFRCVRWYTAPGHDTPGGKADPIKGKVSSSIAHLYQRPRVWLEGYHSLGWGATPTTLMKATCENFLYGCTLLNLHGLYYTTHGGFWEWAPPCYHFRMPYWDHLPVFLTYFERLSYLLSQGFHVCNVAVIYPVAAYDADMGGKEATDAAFDIGNRLLAAGIDFDFMDFQSLARAKIQDQKLQVSGEAYRILIIPKMRAIRWSTIKKAREFYQQGGTVIAFGDLPEASDHAGREDPQLDAVVKELFGATSRELQSGIKPPKQVSSSQGIGLAIDRLDQIPEAIKKIIPVDFQGPPAAMALHRKIGARDVYMVMGAEKGSDCVFRTQGKVELWDPWTGKTKPISVVVETGNGTKVRMPLTKDEAQIVVFSPGHAKATIENTDLIDVSEIQVGQDEITVKGFADTAGNKSASLKLDGKMITVMGRALEPLEPMVLDGEWEFELKPTLDNQWGDFRLPVTEKIIGPEARRFKYQAESASNRTAFDPQCNDSNWEEVTYDFGAKFWKLGPLPNDFDFNALDSQLAGLKHIDPTIPVEIAGKQYTWQPYAFSWRWGVEGDPGHQGYHGLKENVTDDFICLGKPKEGLNETLYVAEATGTNYYLWTSAFVEQAKRINLQIGGLTPSAIFIKGKLVQHLDESLNLESGVNPVLLRYDKPGRGHFVLSEAEAEFPKTKFPLAMKWYGRHEVVPFDVCPEASRPAGWYRFTAPPGLRSMKVAAYGSIQAWGEGKPLKVETKEKRKDGAMECLIQGENSFPNKTNIALRIEPQRGYYGGATIPEPIQLDCGPGWIALGDWSQGSALECYSGGAWYRKNISLSPKQIQGQVLLHLGNVAATAEVHVNGRSAGIRVAPPWTIDITDFIKLGENRLEILVYNTLANHYLTIPTRYHGSLQSGLLGPVKIETRIPVLLKGVIQ